MDFRTKIPLQPQEPKIDYNSKILLLGSCFVENIGRKLEYYKFKTLQNPFGILFHPAAISGFLKRVQSQEMYSENDLFEHNERWHSFEAHSALSSPDKKQILQQLNSGIKETKAFLETASHIIITLGTAWGYKNISSGKIVANCHKLPQKAFQKELLDPKDSISSIIASIEKLNQDVSIIFTISPVRHLKDGFIENQLSKAKLFNALHDFLDYQGKIPSLGAGGLFYFPSYEIMMDELRDYRFYSEDMIHPNQTAINYIWEKFVHVWMNRETDAVMKKVENIQKSLAHNAFYEDSAAHLKFKNNLQQKIEDLKKEFPGIHFSP